MPFTLQTLFVYLAGDLLGSKRGALSQLLFLTMGLLGVPVFALGGGPGYILQPTFGYLVGFPIAAWVIGSILSRKSLRENWWGLLMANGIGILVIFMAGVYYFYINMNFIVLKSLSWKMALWSGVVIFLPGEIVKVVLAAGLTKKVRPWLDRENTR